jgi:ribosomal protein L25 (general stress protein Ctc)
MIFEVKAHKRTLQGSGASRRLRRQNRVPAIVYGSAAEPQLIDIDHNEILLNLGKEAFHASVLTLNIDGVDRKRRPPGLAAPPVEAPDPAHAISSGLTRCTQSTSVCRCISSTPTSHRASRSAGGNVSHMCTTTSRSAACRRICRPTSKSTSRTSKPASRSMPPSSSSRPGVDAGRARRRLRRGVDHGQEGRFRHRRGRGRNRRELSAASAIPCSASPGRRPAPAAHGGFFLSQGNRSHVPSPPDRRPRQPRQRVPGEPAQRRLLVH